MKDLTNKENKINLDFRQTIRKYDDEKEKIKNNLSNNTNNTAKNKIKKINMKISIHGKTNRDSSSKNKSKIKELPKFKLFLFGYISKLLLI